MKKNLLSELKELVNNFKFDDPKDREPLKEALDELWECTVESFFDSEWELTVSAWPLNGCISEKRRKAIEKARVTGNVIWEDETFFSMIVEENNEEEVYHAFLDVPAGMLEQVGIRKA